MNQKLFTEWRTLYSSNWGQSHLIRLRIRMRDFVEADIMRHAVEQTMKRYPYFCVKLKKDGEYYLAPNERPVVITDSLSGVTLNTAESNYHLIAFSYSDNWIIMDISHAITDGTGAYAVIRTFLYYYVSERYGVKLPKEGVRLVGDEIPEEEWNDPVAQMTELPVPEGGQMANALNPAKAAGLEEEHQPTVYSIALSESEFMRFNAENNGSPATMVSLLLSRALYRLFPDDPDVIRVTVAVNQRNALKAPLAHQNLVGAAFLEYDENIRKLPLDRQAAFYRETVSAQTTDEMVLGGLANQNGITKMILSKQSDTERIAAAEMIDEMTKDFTSATVSYVGKFNYPETEEYIRDFRLWTRGTGGTIVIEISAVSGKFMIDFIQPFADPMFVNAFLKELDENGITYDLRDVMKLEMPDVKLPWKE